MKQIDKAPYKLGCLFLVACFCFNAVYAQPVPADQNFSFFGSNAANNQSTRITNFGGINYTVATTTPVTSGSNYSFFGNGGTGAAIGGPFRNSNAAFIFNYSITGGTAYMPYATQTPGGSIGCDYRMSFSQTSPADTTNKSGNFWMKSMYLAIGTGNTSDIIIQGFRAGKIVAQATITALSTSDATDVSSSGTDLTYTGGSDAFSGITIQFGTNWTFLDGIRFLIPSGDIPLEIDDLDFEPSDAIAPATQASGTTSLNITGISANINWTPTGSADYNTVFIKATNTGDAAPTVNTDYTANTIFGSGSEIGSTGWYCIYDGKGNSTSVSGLTPGTIYGVMAIAYNGNTLTKNYNTAPGSNFTTFTTIAIPATQASAVAVTNITGTTATLSWALGTGTLRAVFVSLTSTGTASPVFNTNYTASTNVNSGTPIGSTGWRCVYNGTGSTVDINSLSIGQTYRAMVTEYNDNSLGPAYNTFNINAGTGNPVNFTMDNVPVVTSSAATSITHNGAILNGSINDRGDNTTVSFQYSINSGLSSPLTVAGSPLTVTEGSGATPVSVTLSGLTPSTTYYFRARGVNAVAAINATPILNFKTGSVISNVTSPQSNASFKAGQIVTINIAFTSAVTVTGTPTLALNTGAAATYTGGSGTATISFNYTIGAGENVNDLDYASVSALALSGGTIQDAATTNANLTLPTPGATGSLGANKNIIVDTQTPSLTGISISSNNSNTALAKTGNIITVAFASSETLNTPTVTVAGNAAVVTNTGSNNWTAAYTMAGTEAAGVVAFTISFSDIANNAGTAVTATTNSSSVNYDKTDPTLSTVVIVSNNANTALAKTGDVITVNFTSSETLLSASATIAGNTATVSNVSGNNWKAVYTMAAGDANGVIPFSISFNDLAGNAATAVSATTNSSSVNYDKTAPILSTVVISSNNANTALAKTGDIITINFTSDETVSTPSATIAGNAATVSNISGNNWKAVYTMAAGDASGVVSFSISFIDITGNTGTTVTATTNSSTVNYDKTVPTLSTVVIASNNANGSLAKTGDVIMINFTSNETLFTPSATIAGNTATVSNVSGNNWKAVYTMGAGDAGGVVSFSISFSDLSGNAGTAVTATTNSSNVNFDKTAPVLSTVVIASNNANTSLARTGNVVTINFTSNESILTPTVTIAGITATVSNISGNNWRAVYIMTSADAAGTVSFNISFSDLSGNAGTAVTSTTNSSSVNYDKTNPALISVTIVSNNANTALAKAGDVITLNFASGETILIPSVTIAGNTATISNISGNNWKAVYTMTAGDAGGTVSFNISYSDLAGNAGTVITVPTNSSSVNFDKTNPTLTTVFIASNNVNTTFAKAGDVITLNFTSGETIFTPSATIAGNTATVSNISGTNWQAVYTMTAGDADGVIPFSISFSDLSGNAGLIVTTTTNSSSVSFDKTSPSLTLVSISSNNANTAFAKTGDVVTLNFTANEVLSSPIVTIAGQAITPVNTSGNSYTAAYTMVSGDASGAVPFSISFSDRAGNAGVTVITTTNSSSVIFDKTAPTISSINRLVPLTQDFSGNTSVTYRVSFSEAIRNISPAAFQLTQVSGSASGTIASVSASTGSVIDVTINSISGSGSFRMDLKNTGTGITDNAGNLISAGFTSGQLYGNNTAPVITAGPVQSVAICQGLTAAISINNLLAATDVDNGQILTWTVQSGPSHGTLSGFPAIVTVVNGSLVPSGLTYIADAAYSGADAFVIQVSDGSLSVTTTVNVTVNPLPVFTLSSPQGTILCGTGATVNIDAVNGNTYTWYKNGTTISGVSAAQLNVNSIGVYTATAASGAGCVADATNSITIMQLQKPTVDFSFDSYCVNTPVSFTNKSVTGSSGVVTYLWSDGKGGTSTSTAPIFTYTQAGSYTVKLKLTPTNCPAIADSISKTIQIEAPVAATRLATVDAVANTPVQLTARTFPAVYTWIPGTGLSANNIANPVASISGEIKYTIAIKVASGCMTTDTLLVRIFAQNSIMVANVFTPNGDGMNDKLIVNLVGVKNFHFFRVFNRQGKKIFETMNPFEGWDGKINGVLQPMDTYVWVAEGSDQNGAIIHKQGSTTLMR